MKPAFSVITASYNPGAAGLVRTARSLGAQQFKDFEWLLVDGGSNDGSLQTLALEATRQPDAVVSEPDRGIADAWNKGIARARADFVAILNAGDTYDPMFLQTMAKHANPRRIAVSAATVRTADGRLVRRFTPRPALLHRAMHLPHNWCVVPLTIYREIGPYAQRPLAMDFDWFHRYFLMRGSDGFVVVDAVLGDYYLGGTSDENFKDSFRENERILVEQGTPPWQARAWRWFYTGKHALRSLQQSVGQ